MLVLSRKERQTIRIGHEEIELTILEIHGRTVKIGFNAPAGVPIVRGELCDSDPLYAAAPEKSLSCVRAMRSKLIAAIGQANQDEMVVAS